MHAVSIALVVGYGAYLSVMLPKALWLWRSRHSPLIRARFPGLTLCHCLYFIFTAGSLLLGEVRRLEKATFSCAYIVMVAWCAFAGAGLPFILRGAKMFVATSGAETRKKYHYIMNPMWAWKVVVGCTMMITPIPIAVILLKPFMFDNGPDGLCYMLQPWVLTVWFVWGTVGLIFVSAKAAFDSSDDLLVGRELLMSLSIFCVLGCIFFTIRIASDLSDSFHTSTSINHLITVFCAGNPIMTLFWWGDLRWIKDRNIREQMLSPRLGSRNSKVLPETRTCTTLHDGGRFGNTRAILLCAEMAAPFENFLRRAICIESFDFLRAVEQYDAALVAGEGGGIALQEQDQQEPRRAAEKPSMDSTHALYVGICRTYIQPFSDMEVNINSKMRAKTMRLMDAAVFSSNDKVEDRRHVFDPAVTEVYGLLDSNFLAKFKTTPEYKQALRLIESRLELQTVGSDEDGVEVARSLLGSSKALTDGRSTNHTQYSSPRADC